MLTLEYSGSFTHDHSNSEPHPFPRSFCLSKSYSEATYYNFCLFPAGCDPGDTTPLGSGATDCATATELKRQMLN
jgi:hypothetical protein